MLKTLLIAARRFVQPVTIMKKNYLLTIYIKNSQFPASSGILGIGIERLRCAYANSNIDEFIFGKEFCWHS